MLKLRREKAQDKLKETSKHSEIRIAEDSKLYERLHKTMQKQDRRISLLERSYADAMDKYANCMQEHGEATARIDFLEQENSKLKEQDSELKGEITLLQQRLEDCEKKQSE